MIHLRLRTEYSFGDTFAPLPRVIARLKAIGCTAAGVVDKASTWGHVPWHKACTAAGIAPLLGVELCVSDDDKKPSMWFLARNGAGLSELYHAVSSAHRQQLSGKHGSTPRLYRADVAAMSDDIFKFAGDITDGDFLAKVGAVIDLNPASRILNMQKAQVAKAHGLRVVSTSDNSYCAPTDRPVFELASRAGLKQTPQHIEEALANQDTAAEIAASCAGLKLPHAPMVRAPGNLETICREGIAARGMAWSDEYEKRLQYELELIRSKDYESYFIVVADMVQYAKQHMLVGPSRGSAAGSLVCYTSRITEIDPIPPRLYFERFIDVERTDLPDIDLDFPDDKRHMVFEYMAEKYGADNVAHIGTVGRFKPKSALIQVCKALGIPPAATGAVKVAMIERSSADTRASNCLEDTFKTTEPGQAFIKAYPQAEAAMLLEDHASHVGVHAAGLLICNDDIRNYASVDENGIACIDKHSADALGLLKIDVLGLRTLSVIADSGIPIDWYNLPFNDPAAIALFNTGRFCGIFQFDGKAMRDVSKDVAVRSLVDVDAITALARPGPFASGVTAKYIARANGASWTPIHPKVEAVMAETYGLPLYQEHTLAVVRDIGGFGWVAASAIRKAMSKRLGSEFFAKFVDMFLAGAAARGIPEEAARETWELINAMGAWQMNKAHTYSYAVISYWTAYLKAHHPLEFAAANLRNARDEESAIELLREVVREGIEYVAFDVDRSALNWSVHDGKLYGGYMSLNGIGESKGAKLIAARDAGTLTAEQRATLEAAPSPFRNIFPLTTKYAALYDDPKAHGIADAPVRIADIEERLPHKAERVFIAELMHKGLHSANDDVDVKKRGGKKETGQLNYVNLRLRDDTGNIGGRISRYDYNRIGRELLESVPIGAVLLVRAKFFNGIRYAFVSKWKRLDQ